MKPACENITYLEGAATKKRLSYVRAQGAQIAEARSKIAPRESESLIGTSLPLPPPYTLLRPPDHRVGGCGLWEQCAWLVEVWGEERRHRRS